MPGTLQHTATLQNTATHCNILHNARHCNTLMPDGFLWLVTCCCQYACCSVCCSNIRVAACVAACVAGDMCVAVICVLHSPMNPVAGNVLQSMCMLQRVLQLIRMLQSVLHSPICVLHSPMTPAIYTYITATHIINCNTHYNMHIDCNTVHATGVIGQCNTHITATDIINCNTLCKMHIDCNTVPVTLRRVPCCSQCACCSVCCS